MGRWTQRAQELEARSNDAPDTPDLMPRQLPNVVDEPPADIAWRVVAFRAVIPARGPIWPPRIRNTPLCDTPGHCSLCGDALPVEPAPRFPRCAPCVRALWLALNACAKGYPSWR
jgi:hypothetical protein